MILFAGILVSILLTFFIGVFAGISWYYDIPSLIVIIVPLIFFLSASKSGRVINGYIKSSFKKNYQYTTAELERIAKAVKYAARFTMGAGWFGLVGGLIAVFVNLDKPEIIGPNLGVSLVTIFYSIAISFFIFFPVQAWAENKISELD